MVITALTRLRSAPTMGNITTTTLSRRRYSTKKQPGPTGAFYRQFTRPFAKTILIAVLTYQAAYWLWVKGETDEVRAEKDATIAGLEATVKEYESKAKAAVDAKSS